MTARPLGSGHVVEVDRPGKPLGLILMAEGFPYYLTKYHLTVHGHEARLPNALSNGVLPIAVRQKEGIGYE
jgi:hypothetical protein